MTFENYATKVLRIALRNGNFPSNNLEDLFHRLQHCFVTSKKISYRRDRSASRSWLSKAGAGMILTDVFTEERFALAFNRDAPEEVQLYGRLVKHSIDDVQHITFSQFITFLLNRRYMTHFEDDIDGDFRSMDEHQWNLEYTLALCGEHSRPWLVEVELVDKPEPAGPGALKREV